MNRAVSTIISGTLFLAIAMGEVCDATADSVDAKADSKSFAQNGTTLLMIEHFDRGRYRSNGLHLSANEDTSVGYLSSASSDFNGFVAFDLSGVTGPITTGSLRLEVDLYQSGGLQEGVGIYDVSTPAASVLAGGFAPAIYTDLGTGNFYAFFAVPFTAVGTIITVELNAQAMTDINAALGGTFIVGLDLNTLEQAITNEAVRFGGSGVVVSHKLVLTQSSQTPTPTPTPTPTLTPTATPTITPTSTPTSTPCCVGDASEPRDSTVNVSDFAAVKRYLGGAPGSGDAGEAACPWDGAVNVSDFAAVKRFLGGPCIPAP